MDYCLKIASKTEELLDKVGLPAAEYANRKPSELSGGEQQQLALLQRAIVNQKSYWWTNLFSLGCHFHASRLTKDLHKEFGMTTLVTHDTDEAKLGDRIRGATEGGQVADSGDHSSRPTTLWQICLEVLTMSACATFQEFWRLAHSLNTCSFITDDFLAVPLAIYYLSTRKRPATGVLSSWSSRPVNFMAHRALHSSWELEHFRPWHFVIYAIFPFFKNTITGFYKGLIKLKTGSPLGWLSGSDSKFEIPLAMPSSCLGFRTAAVMIIGTATLAALIGAGGLGFILRVDRNNASLILHLTSAQLLSHRL